MRKGRVSMDIAEYKTMSLEEKISITNVTAKNFNIQKAEIELLNNGEEKKLLANMKYRKPGIYLVSIRNRMGMEAARVYLNEDTILINDRVYKRLYCISTDYLLDKYGISTQILPIINGDFISDIKKRADIIECEEGNMEIRENIQKREIWYYVDCEIKKAVAARISDIYNKKEINFKFSNFKVYEGTIFPEYIEIEDFTKQTIIKIEISDIEFGKTENIEFTPGQNYEKILVK